MSRVAVSLLYRRLSDSLLCRRLAPAATSSSPLPRRDLLPDGSTMAKLFNSVLEIAKAGLKPHRNRSHNRATDGSRIQSPLPGPVPLLTPQGSTCCEHTAITKVHHQRVGKYKEAMTWYYKLLELSKNSGCTEAYDAVTDCYAKLYDLEAAEKLYYKYISRLLPQIKLDR